MKPLALVLATLTLVACDTDFDPIAPSGRVFSMSGYLDASADTQWVRVEPLARTTDPVPGEIDAAVALVLPGGARVPMAQRVVAFDTGPAHLFWTTADVVPGRTYHVTAQGPGTPEARATVRVPDDAVVTVTLVDGVENCPTRVTVAGGERLADVQARYRLLGAGRAGERFRFTKLPSLTTDASGAVSARVYFGEDAETMEISGLPGRYPLTTDLVVALGTDDWPDIEGLTLEAALRGAGLGQIENGVGFVGGTVTKTIPFTPGFGFVPPFGDPRPPEPCLEEG